MDLREVTEFIRDFIWYIVAGLIIIFIFTFVVAIQNISGNSMDPTLKEGQLVLVSKFSYRFSSVKRNDIVALNNGGKSYVKRVIGLPGEKIEYMDGMLFINDEAHKETYLNDDVVTYNFLFVDVCNIEDCPEGVIPENKYLVLGDNREESLDSRTPEFGLVDKSDIKGKVIFSLWPLKGI